MRTPCKKAPTFALQLWAALLVLVPFAGAHDFAALCAGRAAIERVYHVNRLEQKTPFEEATLPSLIERLVREDLHKEHALRKVYGVEISPAQLDAELQRIDSTTRAPEILTQIKTALGNDRGSLAQVFAKPILVERELRERFENDDALHATQREAAESLRQALLEKTETGFAGRLELLETNKDGELRETVSWVLTPRPVDEAPPATPIASAPAVETKATAGVYSIESTAQVAQVLSSPGNDPDKAHQLHFEDLPGKLQDVLRAQLRHAGDVSAVIETLDAFQIYLAKEISSTQLAAAVFTLRKQSYEAWLGEQPNP